MRPGLIPFLAVWPWRFGSCAWKFCACFGDHFHLASLGAAWVQHPWPSRGLLLAPASGARHALPR